MEKASPPKPIKTFHKAIILIVIMVAISVVLVILGNQRSNARHRTDNPPISTRKTLSRKDSVASLSWVGRAQSAYRSSIGVETMRRGQDSRL